MKSEEWKKAKEKCDFDGIDINTLEEKFQHALANDYVDSFRKGRLVYVKEFYQDMYKNIHDRHMTYVEAYKALGFNVDELGTDRANAAGKRARQMAKDGTLYKVGPGDFDGTVPMEKMKNLKGEELTAYLQARCMWLETALEVEKEKNRSFYHEKYSELKKAGKIK